MKPSDRAQISEALLKFAGHVPDDFVRKPRSLVELDRWKATELRLFILYMVPVLHHLRRSFLWDSSLFLKLSCDMRILENPKLFRKETHRAQELLQSFVTCFSADLGEHLVSYNIHALLHICEEVKSSSNYFAVQDHSAFPFEDYLQSLKKCLRSRNLPLEQLVRRFSERAGSFVENRVKRKNRTSSKNRMIIFKKDSSLVIGSYKDNLVTEVFSSVRNVFSEPIPSSLIGIFLVSGSRQVSFEMPTVFERAMLIPIETSKCIAISLLHSAS